jgi:O-antigen/teichoic acid export membrane protein
MLIFTLLDPIRLTVANIFITQGKPEILIRVRFIQLIFLIFGLVILGGTLGIAGVALAMDGMLLIGMIIMFIRARDFVDFSVKEMFLNPTIALFIGLFITSLIIIIPDFPTDYWFSAGIKTISFIGVYVICMLILEYKRILLMSVWIISLLKKESF